MNLHIASISVILRCNYRHVQFYFKLHSYPLPEKENYQKKKVNFSYKQKFSISNKI